jgi:hypothetical protein
MLLYVLKYLHVSRCPFLTIHDSQPFTANFPRGDIYEMISPDLLHQLIKGTFKDHLVTWICEYLVIQYGERQAGIILDDIDQRYIHRLSLYTAG